MSERQPFPGASYDQWKTRSDRDDWSAQNQPLAADYDDGHWRELIKTIVARIGVDRFVALADEVMGQQEERG